MPPVPVAPLSAPASRVGFFGKLPSHGDFVTRGLRIQTRAGVDRWLAEGLRATINGPSLGAALRFSTAPGALCAAALSGVLVKSRDKVGRAYPLMVATERSPSGGLFAEAWFAGVERALQAALAAGADADGLASSLDSLEPPLAAEGESLDPPRSVWWPAGLTEDRFEIDQPLDGSSYAALAARPWRRRFEASPSPAASDQKDVYE